MKSKIYLPETELSRSVIGYAEEVARSTSESSGGRRGKGWDAPPARLYDSAPPDCQNRPSSSAYDGPGGSLDGLHAVARALAQMTTRNRLRGRFRP